MLGWTQVINYCFPACPPDTLLPTFLIDTYRIEVGPRGAGMGSYKYTREGWQPLPLAGQLSVPWLPFSAPRPDPVLASQWTVASL